MNATFAKFLIPAALLSMAACADATDDEGLPPDAEFGIESVGGAADSYGVRPNTPEAEAVLAFTNQAIADDAAGQQFLTLIDSKLHKTAAKNIVAYRAGADGTFGTADDQTFPELKVLDGISYVGRVALMQLYDLAIAAGYGQQGQVNCSDYMPPRNGTFYLRTYEDLLVIEQSHCNTIDGNLDINFSNQYMPTRGRRMASLDGVTEIQGNLNVNADDSFEIIVMRGLKTISGNIDINSRGTHKVEMTVLPEANDVTLRNVDTYAFPKLQTASTLYFITNRAAIAGFDALEEVGNFTVTYGVYTGLDVAFPALKQVTGTMNIQGPRYDARLTGGFTALTEVGDLSLYRISTASLDMSKLKTVNGNATLREISDSSAPFTALEAVGGSLNIGTAYMPNTTVFDGFDKLETVGHGLSVQVQQSGSAFDAFSALQSAGTININIQCGSRTFDGFEKLTEVQSLSLTTAQCAFEGFDILEEVPGSVTLAGGTLSMAGFGKLNLIGGNLSYAMNSDQTLPELELVGGSFSLSVGNAQDLTGFNALEAVEGHFSVRGTPRSLSGLQALDGVGGNASFPRNMDRTDVDRVLDQMSQFSGQVTFN